MSGSVGRVQARTAVVWDVLEPVLDGQPLDVIDIGGGTGGSAVRIAGRGHRVTVVDPSPDALAALGRRADELGVTVTAHQGELSSLTEVVPPGSADLVLCHGVLEMVDEPGTALEALREVLRPGGQLSLLVGQRSAAVLAQAIGGHFEAARELLDDTGPLGRSGRRFTQVEVEDVVAGAGFGVESVHGIRVFTDLVPGQVLDLEASGHDDLVALERAAASRAEYLPLAARLHLMARRS